MKYFDDHPNVIWWASEELPIPYVSPVDNRTHRYFPDFIIKVREQSGDVKKYVIEIKPKRQTMPPVQTSKKRTRTFINEVKTYAVNEAKWKAAKEWCADRMLEFRIITENELGIG